MGGGVYFNGYTNGTLFACLKGKKFTFNENYFHQYANIGATILDADQNDKLLDYLYLLTLPWFYAPADKDVLECQELFRKNYGLEFADRFLKIMLYNKELFLDRQNPKTPEAPPPPPPPHILIRIARRLKREIKSFLK